jgi:bifunctional DNA-binding transcriptional regulator/antitoxin component of YhaV-PrlF toxin-antitoxin module
MHVTIIPESGIPEIGGYMELVKLGKKGQLSIPRAVLKRVGIENETPMLVDTTPDGAIILRQAAVYPIEIYSDERLREFLEADTMTPAKAKKLRMALKASK